MYWAFFFSLFSYLIYLYVILFGLLVSAAVFDISHVAHFFSSILIGSGTGFFKMTFQFHFMELIANI